jgi:outer membrane immunogenic protein
MMKRLLLGTALVSAGIALSGPALAQSASPPVPFANWTGFYAGAQLGYGWQGGVANQIFADPVALAAGSSAGATYGAGGVLGGVHVGWNYQTSGVVLGLESDLELSGVRGSRSPLGFFSSGTTPAGGSQPVPGSARSQADWFGSLRARLGVLATPELLIYATAGAAYGGLKSYLTVDGAPSVTVSQSRTAFGWTAGLGVEWAFARQWTARLEYRHVELGTQRTPLPAGVFSNNPTVYSSNFGRFETVRAGVSYRF